ncbi:hypothetical protein TanjilG_17136 [Lupinus angustifolius]|uniref:Cytokinin riboside 5'-monophosphate phosphoribohydrolase n=1 Tax=Lupinus angustifolius TaxID=3871 RepID=A0A4P1R0Z8_LUPAN|nr:hypothetical protein TanjilG_17136 [Lupinus angustifolius]
MKESRFKRICVFCGSSPGNKTTYKDAAIELGKELVSRNIDLVYGGGSIGLMGLVSQAVYDGGRHVIGVIPKTLMPREASKKNVYWSPPPSLFYWLVYSLSTILGRLIIESREYFPQHERVASKLSWENGQPEYSSSD